MIRPLRVDFVERRAWKGVWAGALVMAVVMAGLSATPLRKQLTELAALQTQRNQLQSIPTPQSQRTEASADPAVLGIAELLRQDLAPALNAAEAQLPGAARLIGITLVNPGGNARLEYQLQSPAQVELVADVLNGGHAVAPWKLRDLTAVDANSGFGATSPSGASIRATWETLVGQLQR